MIKFLKALADSMRLQIVLILDMGEFSVQEIMEILQAGQSRISRHLKILTDAGITECRREGSWCFYYLDKTSGEYTEFILNVIDHLKKNSEYGMISDAVHRVFEKRRERSLQYFSRVGSEWQRIRKDLFSISELDEIMMRGIGHPRILADLGCGQGESILNLSNLAERFIGVDNSSQMLATAREFLKSIGTRVDLRLGNLEHLPIRDEEVDGVLLSLVLHHIAQPSEVFSEIYRILCGGGRFVMMEFDRHENESFRDLMGDLWLGFSGDDIRSWLEQAGFSNVQIQKIKSTEMKQWFLAVTAEKQ